MDTALGEALGAFDRALRGLDEVAAEDAVLAEHLFAGTHDWIALLDYKLVPQLTGAGCLIVAVSGGTNTGKSTVTNALLGRTVSPVVSTAAATRHILLAGNARRAKQCLAGKLLPEFPPQPLEDPQALVRDGAAFQTVFAATVETLPERLVILDTPDVDSIDQQNWEVARHIQAAGDVLVAVLTAEKYKDDRVIAFFRAARASGRIVLPVMNKANPADDFAVARAQLDEFRRDADIGDAPSFVLPHDFDVGEHLDRPIVALDGGLDLRPYLETLDVPAIKQQVHRDSVARFVADAGAFLDRCEATAKSLRAVHGEFVERAAAASREYDPAPGAEVGGLFHEFVLEKRGVLRRSIGQASAAVVKGLGTVARTVGKAVQRRTQLETPEPGAGPGEEALRDAHLQALKQITYRLLARYRDYAAGLGPPAAPLIEQGLGALETDAVVQAVTQETVRSDSISDEFRKHARRTIEQWWNDRTMKRRIVEAIDTTLAVAPAAIAIPISMYTAGFGASETVVIAAPVVEQFLAGVIEYQFGDQMLGLLAPWKADQQRNFLDALTAHVTGPALAPLESRCAPLERDYLPAMREALEICRKTL